MSVIELSMFAFVYCLRKSKNAVLLTNAIPISKINKYRDLQHIAENVLMILQMFFR